MPRSTIDISAGVALSILTTLDAMGVKVVASRDSMDDVVTLVIEGEAVPDIPKVKGTVDRHVADGEVTLILTLDPA